MSRAAVQRAVPWLMAAVLAGAAPLWAGQRCDNERPPRTATVERGLALAERTLRALDASGAQVVVLARAGQDLSAYGLRYSHLGLAWRTRDTEGQAVWRVLHKLNQCGTPHAAVFRQGLGDFFLDDLWRYEAAWVVPTPEVQQKLLSLLNDEVQSLRLNHRPYSMVSYAWGTRYQQSNQWALETLALALEPAVARAATPAQAREKAQAWLRLQGYAPTTLKIGPLTRLGGRVGSANVAFDDHPPDKRFSDRIDTVTVDSVFAFLQRSALGGAPVRLP